MYKIIDLGSEFESTGERRVDLLGTRLTKTASNEIQAFWDSIERKEDSAYLWVIGVSAMEFYGCNNNGDAFYESDLMKYHDTFVSNANVFLHHVNKDPNKGIGKPIYSFYNPVMHRVELVVEINKNSVGAADIVAKIKAGEPIFVSMGCNVVFDVCSICGNKAKTRAQYCTHLKYNIKKILPDGKQVYAINPNPKFFDISIVRKPADPTAFTLDKAASEHSENEVLTSAELGEHSEYLTQKLAALSKLSDIIKKVDGLITDTKDEDGEVNVLRQVAKRGFNGIGYPAFDYEEINKCGVSPAQLLVGLSQMNAPITFGDILYSGAKTSFGDSFSNDSLAKVLAYLPMAIEILKSSEGVDLFSTALHSLMNQQEKPAEARVVIQVIRPVADARASLISNLIPDGFTTKLAYTSGIPGITSPIVVQGGDKSLSRVVALLSNNVQGNLRPITVTDSSGNTYQSTVGDARTTSIIEAIPNSVKVALGGALIAASIGALATNPTSVANIITGVLSGSVGAKLLTDKASFRTNEGYDVPVGVQLTKSAALRGNAYTYAGMAIPAALQLDYLYNKHKYQGEDPEWHLSPTGRVLHRMGHVANDNPVASIVASGALARIAAKKLRLRL